MKELKPIIRWCGGKSKLATKIISQFPSHRCYVEPFCGGAAVFFKKQPSHCEVINDVNNELINLYRCIQHHPDEIAKQSATMLHSRWLFDRLKSHHPNQLTDIQRAARFYALQRMAFGGKASNQSFGYARTAKAGLSSNRFKRDVSLLTDRLNGVFIESTEWLDCVERYDSKDTLVFCDPPYWGTTGYGVEFGFDNYQQMATVMKTMQGKMIVTVNDIPEMHECFAGFAIEKMEICYSLGRPQSGKNRLQSFELLIKNF
jgi:DNA adenine methylase